MSKKQNQIVSSTPTTSQYFPLKIFDLVKTKSKIPVLSARHYLSPSNNDRTERFLKPNEYQQSKIPTYKLNRKSNNLKPMTDAAKTRDGSSSSRDRAQKGKTKSQKQIKLHGLELTSLPFDLFQRSDLETLILSPERKSCLDFKLSHLPGDIQNLTSLKILVLDTNELEAVPDEITNLRNLETLVLSNNCLSSLPGSLSDLINLKSLHLANNRFHTFPKDVCSLESLGFLDLSDNDLITLPDDISRLSNTLHTLLLLLNGIEKLPITFSALTSLTCLWLGENDLTMLPEDFGELFRLDWGTRPCSSNIDGNPLVRPPLSICRQGPYEIRKYFHEMQEKKKRLVEKGQTRKHYESKSPAIANI